MTKRQAEVLRFVREFIAKNGYSPSLCEIAEAVGSWGGTVHGMLTRLESRGYIKRSGGWRNIKVVKGAADVARAA